MGELLRRAIRKAQSRSNKRLYRKKKPFDPEGSGYDYKTARKHGMKADKRGKWASRVIETGQILKGRKHTTYHLTEKGEADAGYEIYQGKDKKYYSRKKAVK